MIKQEVVEQDGIVTEVLTDGKFRVKLIANDSLIVVAYLAGNLRKRWYSRVIVNDKVKLEMSPNPGNQARISYVYRYKK